VKLEAPWLELPEVRILAQAFAGAELRFVGGCVRDTLLGRAVHELDAATSALPEQVIALLEAAGLRAIPTGLAHGTVTALVNGRSFEITTLRKDVTTDGRHAEVAFTDAWEEDAQRRDFTMNALYVGLDGTLYDYVGGLADCKAGLVRFIGDAASRIQEDYLRILRYFRFVATAGNHRFDEQALAACGAHKQGIAQLSGERIAAELLKLLAAEQCASVLARMEAEGILAFVLPGCKFPASALEKLDGLQAPALVKLAALVTDVAATAKHLKLSSKQVKSLELWREQAAEVSPAMTILQQQKMVRRLGGDHYLCTLQLACALSGHEWEAYAPLAAMQSWAPPVFPVTAGDLLQRGFNEGKSLGDALRKMEIAWEESGYSLGRDQLLRD